MSSVPDPVRDRTILITGGAGFIGSHIAAELVDRNEVRVLDDLSTGHRSAIPNGTRFIEGSIENSGCLADAMKGVDLVFHNAAEVSVERSVKRPIETNTVNVAATLSVLERARREDARVVFASSAAVYGDPEVIPVREAEPLTPRSPYGISKLAADHYTRRYTALYDLSTVTLRYFNVYGPGQSNNGYAGVIRTFLDQARNDEPLTVHGDGSQRRDFVHVDDVVAANLAAAQTSEVGRAFNIGTGVSVSIRELAALVREVTGANSPIIHEDRRAGDVQDSRADISAARAVLEFEPSVDLRSGLSALAAEGSMAGQRA